MTGSIFLIHDDGQLTAMSAAAYDSEALLQTLLAQYPDVLSGDEIAPQAPRRWLLVSREMAVPGEPDGPSRWSLDHLFLDQDGIPTLVEVKRSTDNRIRREVVGQMLDYAANAIAYWPVDTVRNRFEARCVSESLDPDRELTEFLAGDDPTSFWQRVKDHLQAGKVRMVFVADEIPPELQRVIEFLNEQMDPAEVLGVEIRQFAGEGLRTLVPRVIGHTAAAKQKKQGTPSGRAWNEQTVLAEIEARRGPEVAAVARKIVDWAHDKGLGQWSGSGKRDGSLFFKVVGNGREYWPFALWTYGRLEIQFQTLKTVPPFESEHLRNEFLDRLNRMPGASPPADAIAKRPSIDLLTLQNGTALALLLDALGWAVETLRADHLTSTDAALPRL